MPAITESERLTSRVYIGIDPGQGGGLAVLNAKGGVEAISSMPATERDAWDWMKKYCRAIHLDPVAVIERVHSFPKQGVASTFTFGKGYGFLRGLLTASCIPFEEVQPEVWQKALGATKRRQSANKSAHKNGLRALAQQLFPSQPTTLKTCDALLLAEFCRRKTEGRL